MCLKPYRHGVQEFGCGQCMPCRINRRRLWTARMMLESLLHSHNSFVTLTYDNDHLPRDGSVVPSHLQLFLKRLRASISPRVIRFYGVGEYGDRTKRPHYHVVIFGLVYINELRSAWTKGMVHVGELNKDSAGYCAGYITKSLTKKDDPRLGGRHPEFCRMSLKPGIGAGAMETMAKITTSKHGVAAITDTADVPTGFRWAQKIWPLGRYLRRVLREESGFDSPGQPLRAAVISGLKAWAELKPPGARAARESKRIAMYYKSRSINSISKSKRKF